MHATHLPRIVALEKEVSILQNQVKTLTQQGEKMAATLQQLQDESAKLKANVDAFKQTVATEIASLQSQIAALQPDPVAQGKIDQTFQNIEDALADIAPATPPAP